MKKAPRINKEDLFEIKFISPKKGKGVIAKRNIRKGTLITSGTVLFISDDDYELIQNTNLYNYIFQWNDEKKPENKYAIVMSSGEFINHSYHPNARYIYRYTNDTINFIAIRDISKGEEITVTYNGKIGDMTPLHFEVEEN